VICLADCSYLEIRSPLLGELIQIGQSKRGERGCPEIAPSEIRNKKVLGCQYEMTR